ncbi:MAG: SDR family NAD(P)-dependent oxidoreductase [Clostridia bacterium]|nr:SDR family NAD(P)-dependent oxidoreductase [Clostridia bacterium]
MNSVLITGADRGVGYSLCECFLKENWQVYAGQYLPEWPWLNELQKQYPDRLTVLPLDVGSDESVREAVSRIPRLDMLVSNAGIAGGDDEAAVRRIYNVNTLAAIRLVEALLPKMQDGMKRLAFVSSEAGVISIAHRDGGCAYTVSKAMLNATVHCMFRQLRPQGFTFRLYHPGWVRSYMSGRKNMNGRLEPEEAAEAAFRQFTEDRSWEDTLILTDVYGHLWPW